jgi:hypothetical protein
VVGWACWLELVVVLLDLDGLNENECGIISKNNAKMLRD